MQVPYHIPLKWPGCKMDNKISTEKDAITDKKGSGPDPEAKGKEKGVDFSMYFASEVDIMIDHSKPPCQECGSHDADSHHPTCSLQTTKQMAMQLKYYYTAFTEQNKGVNAFYRRMKGEVTFWRGKWAILRQENNALRRKVSRQKREGASG